MSAHEESDVEQQEAPRRTTEREAVLRRFLDLAIIDQAWVFEHVREAISLAAGAPPELDHELAMRGETLEALALVRDHLGLDRPPTPAEYKSTRGAARHRLLERQDRPRLGALARRDRGSQR